MRYSFYKGHLRLSACPDEAMTDVDAVGTGSGVTYHLPGRATAFSYHFDSDAASATHRILRRGINRRFYGSDFKGSMQAKVQCNAVAVVNGVGQLAAGQGVPLEDLVRGSRLISRNTFSLGASIIQSPTVQYNFNCDWTVDLSELSAAGQGMLRLSQPRAPPRMVAYAECVITDTFEGRNGVVQRSDGYMACGARLKRTHMQLPRPVAPFGGLFGIPPYGSPMEVLEFYGKCRIPEGLEFEFAVGGSSATLSIGFDI